MGILRSIIVIAAMLLVSGQVAAQPRPPKGLVIGDSLFAWNRLANGAVSDSIALQTGAEVVDRSRVAGFVLTGGIERQFMAGDWDWVVMNGGGNDLWLGCGCRACEASLTTMISQDGKSGRIPDLVTQILATGARVAYVGYLRSPEIMTPIEHCKKDGDELESRIRKLASTTSRTHFISLEDLVPPRGQGYFSFDLIHPSRMSSFLIGRRVSELIAKER